MVNSDFEPTDKEEEVLRVLSSENRANPYLIRDKTDIGKGDVNTALTRLTSAGWVRKVTRGLYEFVDDPRDTSRYESGGTSEVLQDRSQPAVDVEDALEDWQPGQGGDDTRARREIGRKVLEWLKEQNREVRKSDFVSALYEENHLDRQKPETWWETTAREALQHAVEEGLVEYSGRKYSWKGDTDE